MTIDPAVLSAIAAEYTQTMTSIRGRRVQRLLKREFAGADHVLLAGGGSGGACVIGLSSSGAAWCATDGRGKQAAVVKWRHELDEAVETLFDLHKDSLPILGSRSLPLNQFRGAVRLDVPADRMPAEAGRWWVEVCRALG